jgi:hypothetical protein
MDIETSFTYFFYNNSLRIQKKMFMNVLLVFTFFITISRYACQVPVPVILPIPGGPSFTEWSEKNSRLSKNKRFHIIRQ